MAFVLREHRPMVILALLWIGFLMVLSHLFAPAQGDSPSRQEAAHAAASSNFSCSSNGRAPGGHS